MMQTAFRIEDSVGVEAAGRVLTELLPVLAEARLQGPQNANWIDPDIDGLLALAAAGTWRFITGRQGTQIVCLQHWLVSPDFYIKTRVVATMVDVYNRLPEACDTGAFLRFGILTMRGLGASQIVLPAEPNSSLHRTMEQIGCRLVECLMEA